MSRLSQRRVVAHWVLRRGILPALIVGATLAGAAPASALTYFRLRPDQASATAYFVGTKVVTAGKVPYLAFRTDPSLPDTVWRFVSAGTAGYRGPTLVRIVSRQTGRCLANVSSTPRVAQCADYEDQLWQISIAGRPLRGSGNLPSAGPGYTFQSQYTRGSNPLVLVYNRGLFNGALLDLDPYYVPDGPSIIKRFTIVSANQP